MRALSPDLIFKTGAWAVIFLFLGLIGLKYTPEHGLTRLIGFGEYVTLPPLPEIAAAPHYIRPLSHGYDGQYYAQVACDPLLRDPDLAAALDAPRYRAQRILLPALSYGIAGGNVSGILTVYSLWNLLFFGLLARLLWNWLSPIDGFAWMKWFFCMFSMGVVESVRLSLMDLPAAFFVLLAIRGLGNGGSRTASFSFLLGTLTKETTLLAAPVLWGHFRRKEWKQAMLRGLVLAFPAIVATAAWAWYVREQLPAGGASDRMLSAPLAGLAWAMSDSVSHFLQGDWHMRYALRPLVAGGFLLQAAWLWRHRDVSHPLWRWGMIYGILFLFLGESVWHGSWAVSRACLPLTLAFNLLLPPGRGHALLLIGTNLSMVYAMIRLAVI
jgi:hypothetical protein